MVNVTVRDWPGASGPTLKLAGSKNEFAQWYSALVAGLVNRTVVPAGTVMMSGAMAVVRERSSVVPGAPAVQSTPRSTVSAAADPATRLTPVIRPRSAGLGGALARALTGPPSLKAHKLHGTEVAQANTATYWVPRTL